MQKIFSACCVMICAIILVSSSVISSAELQGSSEQTKMDGTIDIIMENRPPESPSVTGPVVGGPDVELNFSAVTTDDDGDAVFYLWDWGDGNISDWFGPFNSSELMTTNHFWLENGVYEIQVKAKDTNGLESNWSDPHLITIARQIQFKNINIGYVYFQIFGFNQSFLYLHFLEMLEATVFLTSRDLIIEATTTDAVKKVYFEAVNPSWGYIWTREDENGSNGFSSTFNLTLGLYQLMIVAYDNESNLIDYQIIPLCLFLRVGSTGLSGYHGHLVRSRL